MQNYLKEKIPIDNLYFDNSDTQNETTFNNLKSSNDIENAKKIYTINNKGQNFRYLKISSSIFNTHKSCNYRKWKSI